MSFEVLPCGCTTETTVENGVNTFKIAPCSLTCENYRYALEESQRQGKPVEYRETR